MQCWVIAESMNIHLLQCGKDCVWAKSDHPKKRWGGLGWRDTVEGNVVLCVLYTTFVQVSRMLHWLLQFVCARVWAHKSIHGSVSFCSSNGWYVCVFIQPHLHVFVGICICKNTQHSNIYLCVCVCVHGLTPLSDFLFSLWKRFPPPHFTTTHIPLRNLYSWTCMRTRSVCSMLVPFTSCWFESQQ